MNRLLAIAVVVSLSLNLAHFGCSGGGASAESSSPSKRVLAQEFVLVDMDGRELGGLGQHGLILHNRAANVELHGSPDSHPNIFPSKGHVGLYSNPSGGALRMKNKDGQCLVELSLFESGDSYLAELYLCDKKGRPKVSVGVSSVTGARVEISDDANHSRAVLGQAHLVTTKTGATAETAPSSLTLFDKDGKVIFIAPRD